jgi:hypothetical protein
MDFVLSASLQLLRQCPEIRRRYFHPPERARPRIKHALLHDVCLERALCCTQRVATEITRRTFFAGHFADTSHKS